MLNLCREWFTSMSSRSSVRVDVVCCCYVGSFSDWLYSEMNFPNGLPPLPIWYYSSAAWLLPSSPLLSLSTVAFKKTEEADIGGIVQAVMSIVCGNCVVIILLTDVRVCTNWRCKSAVLRTVNLDRRCVGCADIECCVVDSWQMMISLNMCWFFGFTTTWEDVQYDSEIEEAVRFDYWVHWSDSIRNHSIKCNRHRQY